MALKGNAQTTAQTTAPATVDPQTDRTLRTGRDSLADLASQICGTRNGAEQEFSTGSLGYRANGKAITADGVRYQVTVQAVRIGSKPK